MSNPNSQVSGSSYTSLSLISEAPDIRKWFSSYTYESPELGTDEDFCISPGVDVEECDEEKGLYVEDSEIEDEGNSESLRKIRKRYRLEVRDRVDGNRSTIRKGAVEGGDHGCPPAVEVPAYPDSLSLPSEPPDVGNWFSSYAYESPGLDSTDFDVSLSKDYNFSNSDKVEKGEEGPMKDCPKLTVKDELPSCMQKFSNDHGMRARSIGAEGNKSYSVAKKDGSEGSILPSKSNVCPEISSEQSTREAATGNCNFIAEKSVSCQRIEAEALTPIVQEGQQSNNADFLRSPVKKVSYTREYSERCEDNKENKFTVPKNDSGWVLLNHRSREAFCKSINKDVGYSEKGFASMNKKFNLRKNDENSSAQFQRRNSKHERNVASVCSSEDRKDAMVTREVFKETTNFHSSYALESSGKWRCPQKSKPNTGPPLKQLRLERWVHKTCR